MKGGPLRARHALRLLDVSFRLEADRPEAFAILRQLFLTPEFEPRSDTEAICARFHLDAEAGQGCRVEVDGKVAPLGSGSDAAFLVSEWVFLGLLQATRRFALIHAAAVSRHGRGVLVVGPPQAGKTTLSVSLAAHGCEYFSDDVAPVNRENGALHPFRKAAAVRTSRGTREYHLPGLRGPAAQSRAPLPCPIGWVFLLEPRPDRRSGPMPASPRIEEVPRDQMALALLRHTLNRLSDGELASSYGEHPHLKAYGDIFAALSAARCYRLTAVQPEATAQALVDLIDDQMRDGAASAEPLSAGSPF